MKKIILSVALAGLMFTSCSKDDKGNQPQPNPQGTGLVKPDTITLELMGGASFNQWNYSTNGQVINTFDERVTVVLQGGQFVQADGSFNQMYTNPGNQPVYPWLSISVYKGGNQQFLYSVDNGPETESVSHTYTNN